MGRFGVLNDLMELSLPTLHHKPTGLILCRTLIQIASSCDLRVTGPGDVWGELLLGPPVEHQGKVAVTTAAG